MNALKHGLTAPIEATPWASAVSDVEALLATDRLVVEARYELARRIVEYERNVAFQRQLFLGEAINPVPADEVSVEMPADLQEIADMIEFDDGDDISPALARTAKSLTRRVQKLHEQIAARQRREATRESKDALKSADRYHRRSANQLIKQLKSLGDR